MHLNATHQPTSGRMRFSTATKTKNILLAALALLTLCAVETRAANVVVDSTKSWIGYMNVSELPANGGNYVFGSPWGTADLDAYFTNATLVLTPNTSIDRDVPNDAFWWAGGAGGAPNKNMDASMYVQDDTLAGQTIVFNGLCLSNSLVDPYTCVAYIKDFAPDYSSSTATTAALVGGTSFSLTLTAAAGHHIQYGFETIGPDARLANLASLGNVVVSVPTSVNVLVDQSKTWLGYMNVFELPVNGSGYIFGSGWGAGDLNATFSAGVVQLTPNTSIYRDVALSDPFWWQGDGTGNKTMDANYYVENSGLAGQFVTFSGYVWTNSLMSPYTSQAFIKELDPSAGYATVNIVTQSLTSSNFNISTLTSAGHVIQYGFETVGPNANTALTPLATLGQVLVSSNPPPTGPVITGLPSPVYVNSTSNASITVTATGTSLTYRWRKNGVNLNNGGNVSGATSATLALNNVSGADEASYSVVVTDNIGRAATNSSFLVVFNPANLSIDPNATWNGYVNAYFVNGDGSLGGYATGFGYPTDLLRASFSGGVANLSPNTSLYNLSDAYWTNPDGTPNKYVEADFYIANDALAGQTLTLNGYCPSNSIDASYTASVWIEDFSPGYALNASTNLALVGGQPFSITLPTSGGDHIQYGLRVLGVDNAPGSPLTLGVAQVSIVPPVIAASRAGNVTTLSFPSVSGHTYTLLYKTNLTDSTWSTLSSVGGTGATINATDTTTSARRFYRLSVQ
jgi:Immunoglobulin I-set domain